MNWRGKPLISHEVIVNLIGIISTKNGFTVQAELDKNHYGKGIKITDDELKKINLIKDSFHGDWNYTIAPKCSS